MPRITGIDKSGPFFRPDRNKKFLHNVQDLMAAFAQEGEAEVVAQLRAGESARAEVRGVGRVADHVVGRVHALTGKGWRYNAVISVNTKGLDRRRAVALMAAASELESRIHAFRRATGRIRRAVKKIDLTKGWGE